MNALRTYRRRLRFMEVLFPALLLVITGSTLAIAHPAAPEEESAPLHLDSLRPCINVLDVTFGTLARGESRTRTLHICNAGQGTVTFKSPWVTATGTEFTIASAEVEKLKTAQLGPNQCIDISVGFSSAGAGQFQSVVRFWASTRECRDTAVLTALVTKPVPVLSGHEWGQVWVTTLSPCTRDPLARYESDVVLYNGGTRDFHVAKIFLTGKDADDGYFKLDTTDPAKTVRIGDVITAGDSATHRRLQHVIFTPKDEREYQATLVVITDSNPPDTIRTTLHGTGVETHLTTSKVDFDTVVFTTPGSTTATQSVTLTVPQSRALTITALTITGTDAAEFSINAPALPVTVQPGSSLTIPIAFTPVRRGAKSATLVVSGDQSHCDDSTALIAAVGETEAAVPEERSNARVDGIEPNPFAASTMVRFSLVSGGATTVEICDAAGRAVSTLADGFLPAGEHQLRWDAAGLPSGVYYCRIRSGSMTSSQPMMLVR